MSSLRLTDDDVAGGLGVDPLTVHDWCLGERSPLDLVMRKTVLKFFLKHAYDFLHFSKGRHRIYQGAYESPEKID